MCVKSLIKRIAPFFLTFAVGLFIASFFVTVAAPNFQFRRGFNRHREMDRQMQCENQRLRDENERLRNRLEDAERSDWVINPDIDVPPPPPVAPSMPMKTIPYKPR
jgi:hypothetical protein